MVLLSDGKNSDCDSSDANNGIARDCDPNNATLKLARNAATNGVTIYTIGYGSTSEFDQPFLNETAHVGNGQYYQATDADELTSIFNDIRRSVARTQAITRAPISTNYSSPSQVYAPQAAGNVDQVAQIEIDGRDFPNINDPTADSRFSHTFAVGGGDTVAMEAYDYDCDEVVDTGRRRSHDGTVYRVARCSEVSMNTTVSPSGIYHDGDSIAHLLREDRAWWQDDLNDTFAEYDDSGVNNTAGPHFGELDLRSNQALVWYDLPDNADGSNRLLMLYEIGIAESNAQSAGVINVRVSNINVTG